MQRVVALFLLTVLGVALAGYFTLGVSCKVAATEGNPRMDLGADLQSLEMTPTDPSSGRSVGVLEVTLVWPGSAAAKAGLQKGDKIVVWNGKRFATPQDADVAYRKTLSAGSPGQVVSLHVRRGKEEFPAKMVLQAGPTYPMDREIQPNLYAQKDPFEQLVQKRLTEHKLNEVYETLTSFFAAKDREHFDPFMSEQFLFAHRQPLKVPALAHQLTGKIAHAYRGDLPLANTIHAAVGLSGNWEEPEKLTRNASDLDAAAHLEQFGKQIDAVQQLLDEAFLHTSQEEVTGFYQLIATIASMPGPDKTFEAVLPAAKVYRLVDQEKLALAAQHLALLDDAPYLEALRASLVAGLKGRAPIRVKGITGVVLADVTTKAGRLIIGGPGDNVYDVDVPILIDVGGNDTYKNRAGGINNPVQRLSVCLDLGGNDRYEAKGNFSLGCGFFGLGLLLDVSGNDTYRAPKAAQGCGLFGIGMLVDKAGADTYTLGEIGQGAGVFGLGLLIDAQGDDTYKAALNGQAFAHSGGVGVLLDGSGNDRYHATGVYPSGYGDDPKGTFSGRSQGYATGDRGQMAGGVAALIDGSGNDTYDAGNFSQGGGYWFALGMIRDLAGNDTYTGTRYSQGFGCHMGVGILYDDKGNDQYNCRRTANHGAGWDASSGFLVDGQGNDIYRTDGRIHQGGAAQNSFALLIDGSGKDQYLGANPGSGQPHAPEFGKPGFSLGIFLDLGGERDTYQGNRSNNNQVLESSSEAKYGLFSDRVE